MTDDHGKQPEDVRGGPNPAPVTLHGSGQCGPTVLPTPTFITDYLSPESLRKLNLIQLRFAQRVTKAQLEAYSELEKVFETCPTDVRGGPNP